MPKNPPRPEITIIVDGFCHGCDRHMQTVYRPKLIELRCLTCGAFRGVFHSRCRHITAFNVNHGK